MLYMYLHTAPHDYDDVNEVLLLKAGCDTACVDIAIVKDGVFELDEYFYVLISTADRRVSVRAFYATVRIQNSASGQ